MEIDLLPLYELAFAERILLVLAIVAAAHIGVRLMRFIGQQLISTQTLQRWTKFRTLIGLITSVAVFSIYFSAAGYILLEFGVSITAYLASASIIGLAIGFGSQGVVQDVMTGITVIFSDLFHVGDLVEISGQSGIVEKIGMRFTVLLNPMGAQVFIPNRTLANVIIYPRGYVRCFVDVSLVGDNTENLYTIESVEKITDSFVHHYPGIFRDVPEVELVDTEPDERKFMRIKFRIWPGRNSPIEGIYKQEILQACKRHQPDYLDWMISINLEVDEIPKAITPFRARKKDVE